MFGNKGKDQSGMGEAFFPCDGTKEEWGSSSYIWVVFDAFRLYQGPLLKLSYKARDIEFYSVTGQGKHA